MPAVKKGETQQDYVNRAVPYMIKEEKLTKQQALGKAYGLYREKYGQK